MALALDPDDVSCLDAYSDLNPLFRLLEDTPGSPCRPCLAALWAI